MASFSIAADHQPVIEALNRLAYVFTAPGMRPAMKEIGERLSDSTKDRFQASVAPDGTAWEPISPITRFLRAKKGRPGGGMRYACPPCTVLAVIPSASHAQNRNPPRQSTRFLRRR